MTILNLIDLWPRKFGGFEEYFLILSLALARRKYKSVLGFSELPPPWLLEKYQDAGSSVERVNLNGPRPSRREMLRDVIQKHRVDILHGTFLSVFSLDTVAMKRLGVRKVIFSDQTSRTPVIRCWFRDGMARMKNRILCHWIDRIIADAEYVKNDLITKSWVDPSKIDVVYNGVNTERFDPTHAPSLDRESLGIPPDGFVVTTIANFIPWKGLDVFLRMAQQVQQRGIAATYLIVGDGVLFTEIRQLATTLGIAGSTRFLGVRDDVHEIMRLSDVFVLCSLWEEAFALVLLEAMASGVPVVASNIGAIPESVVDGRTGILFPPGDSQAAAAAVVTLLQDKSLRCHMGQAGRRRVTERFTIENWVEKTIDVYETVMNS